MGLPSDEDPLCAIEKNGGVAGATRVTQRSNGTSNITERKKFGEQFSSHSESRRCLYIDHDKLESSFHLRFRNPN
ncbi:hypothetical protein KIN20_029117 [Parelaphostrongylus tenuis]|uniref:Uncharacterized protein n=1 Tax=Parelaphostrongylus tenuis TaxID=148309 RepID=A0AAD5WF98_PARTN|nr:hypothetical protein KIN20_029117 [Parelaphostrongylus tenuis]